MPEQRLVIEHPVERGRRQHRVDRRVDGKRRLQVGEDVGDPVVTEPFACQGDHRDRPVERDDLPADYVAYLESLGQEV